MNLLDHISNFRTFYYVVLSWVIAGLALPAIGATGWSVLSFLLILRTRNLSMIFLSLLTILIFSDSYAYFLVFAADAKIGFVVLTLLFIILNFGEFRGLDNRIFKVFLPFLLFALLASAWSTDVFNAFQKSLSYGILFFVVPLMFQRTLKQNKDFAWDLVYFYTIILASGFLLYIISADLATLVDRYRGILGNPNGLGTLVTLVVILYVTVKQTSIGKAIDLRSEIAFIAVVAMSVIMCESRTALFGILLFFAFFRMRYFSNAFLTVAFLIVVTSYDFILSQLPIIFSAVGLEGFLRVETLDDGSGRFIAWQFAWLQIQEVFFLGGGFGHGEGVFKSNYGYLSLLGHQGNAHNSYLTLWLDTGLVGVLLLISAFLRSIIDSLKQSRYTLPVFFTVLFSANFESWLAASLNPFTSVFLMCITLLQHRKVVDEAVQLSDEEETGETAQGLAGTGPTPAVE